MFYSEAGVICAECAAANVRFKPLIKFYAGSARRGATRDTTGAAPSPSDANPPPSTLHNVFAVLL